jgi:hypothetical protein
MKRALSRRAIVILVCVGAFATTVGVAFAGTITTPSQRPFTVPSDSAGNPVPFDIFGTGFPHSVSIYAEMCDGTPASTPGWSPGVNCDSGSAKAPSLSDASGNVSFLAIDPNHHFPVFKGISPQQKFKCLSPHDPIALDPSFVNGQPDVEFDGAFDWTNCQLRVASQRDSFVGDQAFVTLVLPDAPSGTTTTTSSSSTSTTSTTTTTGPPPPNTTCGMGAGVAQTPPKPPKYTGVVKISKGLLTTPAVKDTKWKLAGSLDNCLHFPIAPKTGSSITGGILKASIELPPGSTCTDVAQSDTPVKASLQVKWSAFSDGKLKPVASDKFK